MSKNLTNVEFRKKHIKENNKFFVMYRRALNVKIRLTSHSLFGWVGLFVLASWHAWLDWEEEEEEETDFWDGGPRDINVSSGSDWWRLGRGFTQAPKSRGNISFTCRISIFYSWLFILSPTLSYPQWERHLLSQMTWSLYMFRSSICGCGFFSHW